MIKLLILAVSTTIHELKAEQILSVDIQRAWKFFSAPNNLALITPPNLGFKTLNLLNDDPIYNGMLIEYIVRPLFGIPVRWQTEILDVNEPYSFTDRQLKGPYKTWIHRHDFTPVENGVLMTDTVKYELPFGPIGKLTHALLVRKRVEAIFAYRKQVLNKLFLPKK